VAVGLAISLAGGAVLLVAATAGLGLPVILPGFFLVTSSIGLILPNATALAVAEHGTRAGSALALIGGLQYVVGAVVAPLVGIAGTGTMLPMAIVIAALSLGAGLSFVTLARPLVGGAGDSAGPASSVT
jgi:DHA1 family bicyclomycin/chloramphenicol resistance-like MFS transporter